MRFVVAAILAAHGIAHFVGFVFSWRIATLAELPFKTTVLADRVDIGNTGILVMGVLWLVVGLGFSIAAVLVSMRVPSALRVTAYIVAASFSLCVIEWPDSRIGLGVDVALAILLLFNARWASFALVR
jgi:hypothetical protein